MDGEERALFERSIAGATSTSTGAALDAALDALGWRDALAVDRRAAVSVLFEHQGRVAATSSALGQVMACALGVEGVAVLPALGRTDPPGEVVGEGLAVRGVGFGLDGCTTAVVVARDVTAVVDVQELALRPIVGLDPMLAMVEVTGERVRAATQPVPSKAAWSVAVAAGQLAIASELVGGARAMLQLARDHAVERIQFGRPIGSFQAVRHRLADSLVAIESADAVLGAAWDDGSPLTAALAKAIAGRSSRAVARHCQQVLAGIGFTTEHPLHRYVRRVVVLDRLLGDARSLTEQLGHDLLRTRQLPAILPL
jgi:alkylation response protein AidB-like acyl-CoA dehydrogenase